MTLEELKKRSDLWMKQVWNRQKSTDKDRKTIVFWESWRDAVIQMAGDQRDPDYELKKRCWSLCAQTMELWRRVSYRPPEATAGGR